MLSPKTHRYFRLYGFTSPPAEWLQAQGEAIAARGGNRIEDQHADSLLQRVKQFNEFLLASGGWRASTTKSPSSPVLFLN